MNLAEARRVTERISVQPGMRLELLEDLTNGWWTLAARMVVPDSTAPPGGTVMVMQMDSTHPDCPVFRTPERLVQHWFEIVRRFYLHEHAEWFRFDGEHVVDPHPELRVQA